MRGSTCASSSTLIVLALLASAVAAQTSGDGLTPFEVPVRRLPIPGDEAAGVSAPAFAVDDPSLEEVVVFGDPTLRGLRLEIERAEDRFHDLFNALNDDDQYDIHCHTETRTGTRISQRVCKANFVDRATAVDGQAYLSFVRGEIGSARIPAAVDIGRKNVVLREKLTTLAGENPELREAILDLAELRRNFDAARRRLLDARE